MVTTYIALDYTMGELMRNPKVITKLQAKVRRGCRTKGKEQIVTEEFLSGMSYLKVVMNVTARARGSFDTPPIHGRN
jgi:hypothetical protein